ncbi:MAG: PEP-CTERM sorting domain-containing protein [Verrucomicrobiaceae bacterium]|nr:MAG: PEP-CTERM sorting domain-containing protein [Verrucomicrobiaceae bacterium]
MIYIPTLRSCFHAVAAAALAGLSLQTAVANDVISFNAIGSQTGGMSTTDVAGAPGVNVPFWNNMNSVQTTAGGAISGSLLSITNNSGTPVNGLQLTWEGTGVARDPGTVSNDQKMFESEWDLFDSGNNTAAVDMTFTLTGVPFAIYDVYFYVQDASNVEIRGGNVTANGVTESIKMFASPQEIPVGPFSYVEADNHFSYTEDSEAGTYLRIENVTGDTLTLTISSQNPGVPRLRMSGFQIAAVPEPATGIAVLGGAGLLIGLRRGRRAVKTR